MANKSGLKTKGSGRKKNKRNARTEQTMSLADKVIAETGCHPLEVLLRGAAGDWKWFGFKEKSLKIGKAVVRDHLTLDDRREFARDALPYCSPKLRPVDEKGNTGLSDLERILSEIDGSVSEEDESEE